MSPLKRLLAALLCASLTASSAGPAWSQTAPAAVPAGGMPAAPVAPGAVSGFASPLLSPAPGLLGQAPSLPVGLSLPAPVPPSPRLGAALPAPAAPVRLSGTARVASAKPADRALPASMPRSALALPRAPEAVVPAAAGSRRVEPDARESPKTSLRELAGGLVEAEAPAKGPGAAARVVLDRFYSGSLPGSQGDAVLPPAGPASPRVWGSGTAFLQRAALSDGRESDGLAPARAPPLSLERTAPEAAAHRSLLAPLAAAALLPFSSVFHELGHYLAARLFHRPARLRYNHVLITDADSLSYPRSIAVSAAGPLFNFILGGALAAAALASAPGPAMAAVLWTFAGVNAFLGATNLIPLDGKMSAWAAGLEKAGQTDGWHAREAWRAWRGEKRRGSSWGDLSARDRRAEVRPEDLADLDARLARIEGPAEDVAVIRSRTRETLELESRFAGLGARALRGTTAALRRRAAAGESLDALLPEAFAACREAMARVLGKRPYAEQVAAGVGVHMGRVLQQNTGEGKTLSIGLAAYLNALAGPVDVYTFNPYLALRDADEVGQVLSYLGMTTGVLQDRDSAYLFMSGGGRQRDAYEGRLARVSRSDAFRRADVLYGYNSAFIFDWLRDRDAGSRGRQVMEGRPRRFAVVDEADAELLEEANTDYRIVSDEADGADSGVRYILGMVSGWKEGEDYLLSPRGGEPELTAKSRAYLAALGKLDPSFERLKHLEQAVRNAIKAQKVLRLNRDYAVIGEEVVILDAHTGRLMWGRYWEAGLHRFVELKEGLSTRKDYRLSSHIALDQFVRMYGKLSGITGTVGDSDPEFERVYGLKALRIPPHRPSVRRDLPDRLYRTEAAKLEAAVQEALAVRRAGRPVLIGVKDLAESVRIAARLKELGEEFLLLNGVQKESEKDIVAYAGRPGALVVATQLAGRGTDIRPEGKALELGGLHVVLTGKSSSRRVDLQYRGRAARQGRPGSSVQFVSLEDELLSRSARPEELAALESALKTGGEGLEVSDPALAAVLAAVQSRSEEAEAAGRDSLRRKDAVLAPVRSSYFALRAAVLGSGGLDDGLRGLGVRWLDTVSPEPFGRRQALEDLSSGWAAFVEEVEDLWVERGEAAGDGGVAASELEALFRDRVVRPFLDGRGVLPRLKGSVRQLGAAARDFFTGSVFERLGSWLGRRVGDALRYRWHRAMARLASRRGRGARAAEHARRAVGRRPEDPVAYFDWAVAEFKAGDYDRAVRGFMAALNLSWDGVVGGIPSSLSITRVSIENLAACLHNRAARRLEARDLLGAAVNLRAAAELDGSAARVKLWEDLRKDLSPEQAALAETPFPFLRSAYLYKGREAVDAERFAEAERHFARALAIDPTMATARFGRAFALNKLEKGAEARADLLEGFKRLLLGSRQFNNLRKIYPKLTGQTLDAAVVESAFSAFRRERPEGGGAGPAQASQGAREKAVRYWAAGRRLLDEGRAREAVPYFDASVESDPRLHQAYDDRGVARFRLEDYRGAFEDMLDSLRWETLDREGRIANLIAGHRTRITWTPEAAAVDEFFAALKGSVSPRHAP